METDGFPVLDEQMWSGETPLLDRLNQAVDEARKHARDADDMAMSTRGVFAGLRAARDIAQQHLDHEAECAIAEEDAGDFTGRDRELILQLRPRAIVRPTVYLGYNAETTDAEGYGYLRRAPNGDLYLYGPVADKERDRAAQQVLPTTFDEVARRVGERNREALTALADVGAEADRPLECFAHLNFAELAEEAHGHVVELLRRRRERYDHDTDGSFQDGLENAVKALEMAMMAIMPESDDTTGPASVTGDEDGPQSEANISDTLDAGLAAVAASEYQQHIRQVPPEADAQDTQVTDGGVT